MLKPSQIVAIALLVLLAIGLGLADRFSSGNVPQKQGQSYRLAQTKNETAKIRSDERIANYTWWLAVLTGCLVGATGIQGYFLLRADETARRSADAAVKSANAASAIEFPIVRTNWLGPDLESTDHLIAGKEPYGSSSVAIWPTRFSVIADIEFRNYGRTPAFAEKISLGWAATKQLPEIPIYNHAIKCAPNTVIGPRDNRDIQIHFGFELPDEQLSSISSSASILWFYGVLTYTDVMDRSHDIGFCWQWGMQYDADSVAYFFDDGNAPPAYKRKT